MRHNDKTYPSYLADIRLATGYPGVCASSAIVKYTVWVNPIQSISGLYSYFRSNIKN